MVGGDASFNNSKVINDENEIIGSGNGIRIFPNIGYFLIDKFAIGINCAKFILLTLYEHCVPLRSVKIFAKIVLDYVRLWITDGTFQMKYCIKNVLIRPICETVL